MSRIINQNHILKISIEDPQILDKHLLLVWYAVLSAETVVNNLIVGIDLVENGCGIAVVRGSEDEDLSDGFKSFEEFDCTGTHVDASFGSVAVGEGHFDEEVTWIGRITIAVDKRLIQIKHESLLLHTPVNRWKLDRLLLQNLRIDSLGRLEIV